MKKIVFLIALTLISSMCMAQRSGGSRTTSSPSRPSVSTSRPSVNRSSATRSTATYSPSRTTTRSSSYTPSRPRNDNSAIYRRSETRSSSVTTNRTPEVRNPRRMENSVVNAGPRVGSHSTHATPHPQHGIPHHGGGYHHPHHPAPHGMHPMPPMHHPIHHHRTVHLHYHPCYNWMHPHLYWYGYWTYVHTYPYDDVVVYVRSSHPSTEVIAISTDSEYVYTIYRDNLIKETYFTITDQSDNILVKLQINKRYCKIFLDESGVWLLKKNDKDPMYLLYQDGKLYRYEED